MSYEACIVINCEFRSDKILDIIKILLNSGWTCFHDNGYVDYLPLGDDDYYDWQSSLISLDEIDGIIIEKQKRNEKVGINIYHKNTGVGICVLAETENQLMFDLDINRKTLRNGVTDVGWYYNNVIIPLIDSGCILKQINFMEYLG